MPTQFFTPDMSDALLDATFTGHYAARFGSMANDGGNLIVETSEFDEVADDPIAAKYLRPLKGSRELVRGLESWCLWLADDFDATDVEKSLAEHYNPLSMAPDLLRTRDKLDREVDKAFGVKRKLTTERQRQELLFTSYGKLTRSQNS